MNIELDGQGGEGKVQTGPSLRRRVAQWGEAKVAHLEHLFARAVAWAATRGWQVTADWRSVRPILSRASAHVAIIILAAAAIIFSGINLPTQDTLMAIGPSQMDNTRSESGQGTTDTDQGATPTSTVNAVNDGAITYAVTNRFDENTTIVPLAHPHTEIPSRPRRGVITYTVQPGDTVQSIAEGFGLNPTTILWSNPDVENAPDMLGIGQNVVILPVDGVYHTVVEDDTLESIAEKYKVEVEDITGLSYNNLQPPLFVIQEGDELIVPGGTKPYVPRRVTSYSGPVPTNATGSGAFGWPVSGTITQGYWWGHRAIDIGAPTGSATLASDSGYVSFVGWTDIGYGYLIILDHGNGYVTYYAHLSQMYVTLGQQVNRGQVIGAVGSTGNSTGPHLHFEIRYNDVQQNPFVYLP